MASRARPMPVEVGGDGRFVVPARERVPAYVATYESGRLREKVDEALEALRACRLCPRDCEVDRPGYLAGLSPDTYVDLMDQYAPAHRVGRDEKFAEIDRRVSRREVAEAVAAARDAGLWRLDARWRRAPRALPLWA